MEYVSTGQDMKNAWGSVSPVMISFRLLAETAAVTSNYGDL